MRFLLLLLNSIILPTVSAQETNQPVKSPTESVSPVTANRCRTLLVNSIVDFYLPHCIDQEHGGYLEALDATGKFTVDQKFLTLQARQLWFFSALANADIQRNDALDAAKSGYTFLNDHFYDSAHGGYFAKTRRDGTPFDRRKHVYPNAFVIYALVEYHRATQAPEPLQKARQLFEVLDERCYDRIHGGYNELFTDDWQIATDASQPSYIGALGTKTYNSHLHLLEAFAQLHRETQDPLVAERLRELIQINTLTVKHPDWPCNIDGWQPDWTRIETKKNLRASYGHDVECSWLVLDAAQTLGFSSSTLRSWATSTCDHAIRFGWDTKHNGFFYSGPLGRPSDDRKKVWWTQSEALVAMLTMHRLTGEEKYKRLFERTFEFVEQNQVARSGGWWATLNADGTPAKDTVRTSMWQGAYHNGRALLLCEQLLSDSSR